MTDDAIAGISHRISIRDFDPKLATPDTWRDFHAYVRQRALDDEPDEPILPDDVRQRDMLVDWPLSQTHRKLALIDDQIVGQLTLWTARPGTDDYDAHKRHISVGCGVRADARRQGVGRTLFVELAAFMRANGQDTATLSSWLDDGNAFLRRVGAGQKQCMIENRLDFSRVAPDMLARWETAVPPGLSWEVHAGRVPLDRYEEIAPPLTVLLNAQPRGGLEFPPFRLHMAQIRAWYADMDQHGGAHHMVLLKSGGDIVAMSEATWDSEFEARAYQGLTAVADAWRGKGLAKAVKARTFRSVREGLPTVRMIITSNAEDNAAMLAVNRQLGFARHREMRTYQISLDALAAALAPDTR